jgi:hypothetical protein
MNKDNIIKWIDEEIKREKAVLGNDGCFVGEVKGTLLGRIQEAERIKEYIQSEPEETKGVEIDTFKNNFDVITESPERLAEYFYDVNKLYAESLGMNMKQSKDDGVAEFIKWLNEKAGE